MIAKDTDLHFMANFANQPAGLPGDGLPPKTEHLSQPLPNVTEPKQTERDLRSLLVPRENELEAKGFTFQDLRNLPLEQLRKLRNYALTVERLQEPKNWPLKEGAVVNNLSYLLGALINRSDESDDVANLQLINLLERISDTQRDQFHIFNRMMWKVKLVENRFQSVCPTELLQQFQAADAYGRDWFGDGWIERMGPLANIAKLCRQNQWNELRSEVCDTMKTLIKGSNPQKAKVSPTIAFAHFELGCYEFNYGSPENAEVHFKWALKIAEKIEAVYKQSLTKTSVSEKPKPRVDPKLCATIMLGRTALRLGDIRKALDHVRSAVDMIEDNKSNDEARSALAYTIRTLADRLDSNRAK